MEIGDHYFNIVPIHDSIFFVFVSQPGNTWKNKKDSGKTLEERHVVTITRCVANPFGEVWGKKTDCKNATRATHDRRNAIKTNPFAMFFQIRNCGNISEGYNWTLEDREECSNEGES